jgi:hypothetical protein
MRNELEIIETIERYLNGSLTAAERSAFEEEMARNPSLQEQVALQTEIMQGIDRAALRQKVAQASHRFRFRRNFLKWGSIVIGIGLLIFAAIHTHKYADAVQQSYIGKNLPQYNEAGDTNWVDADKHLTAQTFNLDAATDTVIETQKGIVLSVPANCFLDQDENPVKGKIQLVVKEALDATTIIDAGLSSRSGDQLLESGGMFFVDARKNGRPLKIDSANGIVAEVPTDTVKPGMNLFHGVRKMDGTIDWSNPRPLNHDLVPVDIRLLDFYPPHYRDSLAAWGYNAADKKFTDSLYFSLAADYKARSKPDAIVKSDSTAPSYIDCGLDPAKVKTIWDEIFQKTVISTREFEARMTMLHTFGNNDLLDLYINNLDKPLSEIDSIAAIGEAGARCEKELMAFYARHDGKVNISSKKFEKLREYYERKATIYREAIAKTQAEFLNEQARLDSIADNKTIEHRDESARQKAENFKDELALNLKNALKQLGYDTAALPLPPANYYSANIVSTGWCNIDRAVVESTLNHTTLNFTDSQTGKKATINYSPVSFSVQDQNDYDRCYVYLLPSGLNSFIRLTDSDERYSEKLNQLMNYNLVCVGYKNDRIFFYSLKNVQPKAYPAIVLTQIGAKQLESKFADLGFSAQAADLKKEFDFIQFDIQDSRRRKHNQGLRELREKVLKVVFPCIISDRDSASVFMVPIRYR